MFEPQRRASFDIRDVLSHFDQQRLLFEIGPPARRFASQDAAELADEFRRKVMSSAPASVLFSKAMMFVMAVLAQVGEVEPHASLRYRDLLLAKADRIPVSWSHS